MQLSFYWVSFYTLLHKEIARFMRIWPQTLLPPAITASLYFIIFGHFIGEQLSTIHGYTYMQYIAPGLIMMNIINSAYANVSFSLYSTRFQKNIEEILVSPLPLPLLLLAYTAGGMARGIVIGVIITLIALCFTHLELQHFMSASAIIILCAALFSLAGFTNALYARKFDDVSIIPTFILTPLTYLGGVFYSLTMLPPFWQKLSLANPIFYMVDTFRYSILGIAEIKPFYAFVFLSVCVVALFGFNWWLLRKGVGVRS